MSLFFQALITVLCFVQTTGQSQVSISGELTVDRGGRVDNLIRQGDTVTLTFRVQNGAANVNYYSIQRLNITAEDMVTSGVNIYEGNELKISGAAARRYNITRSQQGDTVVLVVAITRVVAGDRADYVLKYSNPSGSPRTGGRLSVPIVGDRPQVNVMQGKWFLRNDSLRYVLLEDGSTLTVNKEEYLTHHGFNYTYDAEFGCTAVYNFPAPNLETISLGDKDVTTQFRHKTLIPVQRIDDEQIVILQNTQTDATRGHGTMNSYVPAPEDYGRSLRCQYWSEVFGTVSASVTFKFTGKPAVNCSHEDHIRQLGDVVSITCDVLSNPVLGSFHFMTPLGYNVSKDNDDANFTTSYQSLGNERWRVVLQIKSLRQAHLGLYSFYATNSVGTAGELHVTAVQEVQPTEGSSSSPGLSLALLLASTLLFIF